jgi:protein-tyrosine phosphatase
MDQILSHSLWLGHAREGRDFRQLFDAGIQALVELALEEPPAPPPRELIYCRFPLQDGVGNSPRMLFLAIRTVAALLRRRVPTLVCCATGMSRAPAVAAAALALLKKQSPEEWLQRVLEHHPGDVSPGLWQEITRVLPSLR